MNFVSNFSNAELLKAIDDAAQTRVSFMKRLQDAPDAKKGLMPTEPSPSFQEYEKALSDEKAKRGI